MYNSRIPIDSISLIDYLRSINKLDAVGGEAYILELMGKTLSLVNWKHHAAIVRRDSMLRELIGAPNEINALAITPQRTPKRSSSWPRASCSRLRRARSSRATRR